MWKPKEDTHGWEEGREAEVIGAAHGQRGQPVGGTMGSGYSPYEARGSMDYGVQILKNRGEATGQRHTRGAPQMWARTWAKRMHPCSQVPGRAGEEAGAQGRAGWGGRSAGCSPRASPLPGSFYHELLGGEGTQFGRPRGC